MLNKKLIYLVDLERRIKMNNWTDNVCSFIECVQDKFYKYRNDELYLKEVLKSGANKARSYASLKMDEVYKKVGIKI